jgi:hypothetical protein
MNVKVGDFIKIDNPIGCYMDKEVFKEYVADDVPFYGNKQDYETELKDKVGKVLSIVLHPQSKVPVALVYVNEINTIVAMDINGGHMSMVKQSLPNTVTEELLKSKIVGESYSRMGLKTTVCVLTMANGFEVVGTSACIDPDNFNYELGKKYAFENAYNKLYELEGYLLQSQLKS